MGPIGLIRPKNDFDLFRLCSFLRGFSPESTLLESLPGRISDQSLSQTALCVNSCSENRLRYSRWRGPYQLPPTEPKPWETFPRVTLLSSYDCYGWTQVVSYVRSRWRGGWTQTVSYVRSRGRGVPTSCRPVETPTPVDTQRLVSRV